MKNVYASARNGMIFWHRFVYSKHNDKISVTLSYMRRLAMSLAISTTKGARNLDFSLLKYYLKGYRDAWSFIHSDSYRSLPPI